MRRSPLPLAKPCEQCKNWYFGRCNQKYCRACAAKRKQHSDATTHRDRGRPVEHDLSPGQIEAVFQESLRQIRAERRHTVDIGSSHQWKYTEPGR